MDTLLLRWRNEHILNATDISKFQNLAKTMLNSINNLQDYDYDTKKIILIATLQATFKNQLIQELTDKLADELLVNACIWQELNKDKDILGSINSTSTISKTPATPLVTMATDLQEQILASTADLLFAHCLKTNGALWSPVHPYQDQDHYNLRVDLYKEISALDSSSATVANILESRQIQQYWQAYENLQQWEKDYKILQTQLAQAIDTYQKFKGLHYNIPIDSATSKKISLTTPKKENYNIPVGSSISEEAKFSKIPATDEQHILQRATAISPNQTDNFAHTDEVINTTQDNNSISPSTESFASHLQIHLEQMSYNIFNNPDRGFYAHKWKIWRRPHTHGLDHYSQDYTPEQLDKRYTQAIQHQLKRLQNLNSGRIAPETTTQMPEYTTPPPSEVSLEEELTSSTKVSVSTPTTNPSMQNQNSQVKITANIAHNTLRIYTDFIPDTDQARVSSEALLSPRSYSSYVKSSSSSNSYDSPLEYNPTFYNNETYTTPDVLNDSVPYSATTNSKPRANILANTSYTFSTALHNNTANRPATPIPQYNFVNLPCTTPKPRCGKISSPNAHNSIGRSSNT